MDIWKIDQAFLFIVLVLPGFISIKVYDLIIASGKRDFSKSIIESVAYSVLNFASLSWLIVLISAPGFADNYKFGYWIAIVFIFIIIPASWPFLFVKLSTFKIFKRRLLNPINQPWDKVFNKKESYWITAHLKNGKIIRGKYGLSSSASAYPKERQIYLEEIWKPGKSGGFGKKIKGTKGVILFESEISYIEFHI